MNTEHGRQLRETGADLLTQARRGDTEALGRLMQQYRSYLRLLADARLHRNLQGKADASDVVQDVFVRVQKQFEQFRGESIGEFTAWLKTILVGELAQHFRRYLGTQQRNLHLEQSLEADVDRSSCCLHREPIAAGDSPSRLLMHRETFLEVSAAMDNLPDDYRTVLILRHLEAMTFPQIATDLGRSVDSVEKLWVRALGKLRSAMKVEHDS